MNKCLANYVFLILLILISGAPSAELTARDLVDRSLNLDRGRAMLATTEIRVVEAEKVIRKRQMQIRRKTISGLDHTRVEFLSPADIKGLALLILDRKDGESDQHLYTPALRRVRRIRGSLKSQEFAGTDFSYEDMERRNLDDADHEKVGEETIEGHDCYKIASTTKKRVRSQYGKSVSWIDKESFITRKLDLYDRDGDLIKTLTIKKAESVSGVWTPLNMEMKNHSKNRLTQYEVKKIEYDILLDDNLFATSALGQ